MNRRSFATNLAWLLLAASVVAAGLLTWGWEATDGVPEGQDAAASVSEARPRGSPAGPLSQAEIPAVTQQAAALPDDPAWAWLKDEMASDCSPEQVAEMLTRARVYVETADGRTALGVDVKAPLAYRQAYGVAAVALELRIARCLRWMGRL